MWLYSKAWIVLPALLVNQLWLILVLILVLMLVLMRVLPQLSYVLLLLKWQGMKRAIRRLQRLVYHSDSDSLPVGYVRSRSDVRSSDSDSHSFLPIKARHLGDPRRLDFPSTARTLVVVH